MEMYVLKHIGSKKWNFFSLLAIFKLSINKLFMVIEGFYRSEKFMSVNYKKQIECFQRKFQRAIFTLNACDSPVIDINFTRTYISIILVKLV